METAFPEHTIEIISFSNRVRDLKLRKMREEARAALLAVERKESPPALLTDAEHFAAAFNQALGEEMENDPEIVMGHPDDIFSLKSAVGRELASRPRRPRTQQALDLAGIIITEKIPERDWVEIRDRATNTYGFTRIGRKIECTSTSASFKAPREVIKVARDYFTETPRPKKPLVVKPKVLRMKKPKFPGVVFKTKKKVVTEIIVRVNEHVSGLYMPGEKLPVLVEWRFNDAKVQPSDVPKILRNLSQGHVRLRFKERESRQEAML